jgi:hypothetical protein
VTTSMQALGASAAALALLTGCAASPAAPSEAPATSTEAAVEPSTPQPSPTSDPTVPAEPSLANEPSSAAEPPRCDDAVAVDPEGGGTVSWPGTYEEQLERAHTQPGFSPDHIIDPASMLCALSFQSPVDGATGVAYISTAYVRDVAAVEAVRTWAAEHGYESDGQQDWPEYHLPWPGAHPDDEFTIAAKVHILPVDAVDGGIHEQEQRSGLDLEPTDWIVWHMEFTDEER